MKQRFSSLDVCVIAHELSASLVSLRVSNIYDLSSKIFLIKFAKPGNKKQMVIDSGFRCHLTEFARSTASAPSDFVTKLRRYLKTRRVTQVAQVGTDRIIEFQFSDGSYRLFLEFYAGGNIILTDKELKILVLSRIVSEGEGQEELRMGLTYSLEDRQNYGGIPELTKERLQNALQKAVDKGQTESTAGKKQKKNENDALRRALAVSITEFAPMLVDHSMKVTNFDATLKPAQVLESESLLDGLLKSLEMAKQVVNDITSKDIAQGWIISKKAGEGSSQRSLYDDFHPFKPKQFEDDSKCEFKAIDGFNATVDEFFSAIEGQTLESRLRERKDLAERKIEAARRDQAKRLGGLQELQELNIRKAEAIETNVARVQEAMDAVNGLIAQGMDWVEIGKLIELEQKRKNPVASFIKLPLKLEENSITLLLDEETFEDEEEEDADETDSDVSDSESSEEEAPAKVPMKKSDARLQVDINLAESPWANARQYYDQRRTAAVKEQKTLQSSEKALKSTEQKIAHDLKKGLKQEKAVLRPVRNQLWFEKFSWFISSDGYLVLGGRDAQQNEMLYKRYLRKGDVYVHADINGAGTVVIRNSHPDSPVPPSTLSQAGTLAVASSSAWDSKAGMSPWWVNADQVSKSTPTGDFLPIGSFSVKGKKNFLPPAVLLLGFGVMFRISEQSKAKHLKHRVPDANGDAGSAQSMDHQKIATAEAHISDNDSDIADETDEDESSVQNDELQNPLQTDPQVSSPEPETSTRSITTEVEQLKLEDEQTNSETSDAEVEDEPQQTSSTTPAKKGPAQLPRGKRSKAKKAAAKYRDQDEEDRRAAEALIGSAAGQAKAEEEAKAKAAKEAEAAFQKERRRAQHLRTQAETAKHEEMRKAMLEAGEDLAVDDDEAQKTTNLDDFVGTPLPGDEIIEAIPVCAPWAALGKHKYKAKLQPGAQKKGKAVREIIDRWCKAETIKGALDTTSMDKERVWPREMKLLKSWKAEECINVVPVSKVRVMMAGGAQASGGKDSKGKPKGHPRGKKK